MKYLDLLKNELNKDKDQTKKEEDLVEKADKAKLQSSKHALDLQMELSDKKKALKVAYLSDNLNFRSIALVKKEITEKEQEIKEHIAFHTEMFE